MCAEPGKCLNIHVGVCRCVVQLCVRVCAHGAGDVRPIYVVTGAWGNALTLSFVSCCGVFSDVRCNVLRVLNRLFVV
jgi:hypothetical protein